MPAGKVLVTVLEATSITVTPFVLSVATKTSDPSGPTSIPRG